MNKQNDKLITLGVVLWSAFLCAAVATLLFFATFDPVELAEVATFPMQLDRSSGYSAGFFLFWLLLLANGTLVSWLLASRTKSNERNTDSSQKQ